MYITNGLTLIANKCLFSRAQYVELSQVDHCVPCNSNVSSSLFSLLLDIMKHT